MKLVRASTNFCKVGAVASLIAVSALTTLAQAPAATAADLVPQAEGEVCVAGLAPFGSCLATPDYTVTSLIDATTQSLSRLFVDATGTANTYGSVSFAETDLGTIQTPGFWFRPVAIAADGVTPLKENGQLEVGTFKFDFTDAIQTLLVRWFDVEVEDETTFDVLDVNGSSVAGAVPAGADSNLYEQTFANVKSITLKLGANNKGFVTGDGVDFQLVSVPEPAVTLGLGAITLGSILGLRRRQRTI